MCRFECDYQCIGMFLLQMYVFSGICSIFYYICILSICSIFYFGGWVGVEFRI